MEERNLTENILIELGFEKTIVPPEEAGDERGYYYFTYELYNGNCLISNSDDMCDNNGCYDITIFNMEDAGIFDNIDVVENLIKAIKTGKRGGE